MIRQIQTILLIVMFLATPTLWAGEKNAPDLDRINLTVQAGGQVDTDVVVAIVYMEQQSSDQSMAANDVNTGVRWALDKATAMGVKANPFQYRTIPVYRKRHIANWRVHQSLRLVSKDPTKIGNLLGVLQQKLVVQSLQHTLSEPARLVAEENFIVKGLQAFERRAQLIAQSLKRPGYKIIQLNINTDSPVRPVMRMMQATGNDAAPSPVVRGGQKAIWIRINATIKLDPKP